MAQAVTVGPTIANQILAVGSYQDIPGLSITCLNGSGWIFLLYSFQLLNLYAGANPAFFQFSVDGAPHPNSGRGATLAQSGQANVNCCYAIKPGAGQHIYTVQGQTLNADMQIVLQNGSLILQEPGY
jgi:hypothetical protein